MTPRHLVSGYRRFEVPYSVILERSFLHKAIYQAPNRAQATNRYFTAKLFILLGDKYRILSE
jgi:hypothetical protein